MPVIPSKSCPRCRLDSLLGGGWAPGQMTELVGAVGTGKTQVWCLPEAAALSDTERNVWVLHCHAMCQCICQEALHALGTTSTTAFISGCHSFAAGVPATAACSSACLRAVFLVHETGLPPQEPASALKATLLPAGSACKSMAGTPTLNLGTSYERSATAHKAELCCLQLCLQAVLTAGTLYPDTSILYVDTLGGFSTARLAGMYQTRSRHAQVGLMMLTCECSTCRPITLREPADRRQTRN